MLSSLPAVEPGASRGFGQTANRRRPGKRDMITLEPGHPARGGLESFIARQYETIFDARLCEFPPLLLGRRGRAGDWVAGIGLRDAEGNRLLLENYLSEPVEQALQARTGTKIPRRGIVELGSFAISDWRGLRRLFTGVAVHCRKAGYEWIACTATGHLERLFRGYGIEPVQLGNASPERLAGADTWGRYFENRPRVLAAPVEHCCARLERKRKCA